MADKKEVQITPARLDAMMLPAGFSRAYQMYVLQQPADMEKIAGKANSAGREAETAQQQNARQDAQIAQQDNAVKKISADYVSKSAPAPQAIASAFGAASFTVNGVQVVGARVTGFTPASGSAFKGAFDADKAFDAGSAPDGLKETRQRIRALEDALRAHGLIS